MKLINSFDSLLKHLEDENGLYARSSLEAYFYKNAYTGSSFELLRGNDPYVFTSDDLVAVSMLGINIPPHASRWILRDGRDMLHTLLREIDKDLSIQCKDADLSKEGFPWQLWKALISLPGVGETKCSKLLAVKRPTLFPIYDKHVAESLSLSRDDYWLPWQVFMWSAEGKHATQIVNDLAKQIDQSNIPTLRLLDIIMWMQRHGHKAITKRMVNEEKMIAVNYAQPK